MATAIIIAGGSGSRMGQDIPKQFINVYDKPVLIYTMEGFQKHPQIDAIEVVCIDGWHDVVWAYAKQFNISKLKWIVSGGNTGPLFVKVVVSDSVLGMYTYRPSCTPSSSEYIPVG